MPELPKIHAVTDIHLGRDAGQEAWVQHFLIENNIDPQLSPGLVATREQLRFMVALDDDQVYVPCADSLFLQFYNGKVSPALQHEYDDAWQFVETLVEGSDLSPVERQRILRLCRYRFDLYVGSRMILPSRLIKRLVGIVLQQLSDPDPFREKKQLANAHMAQILEDPAYLAHIRACPDVGCGLTLADLRWQLDYIELERLFRVATLRSLWGGKLSPQNLAADLNEPCADAGCLHDLFGPETNPRKKILYIPDVSGGFMVDLLLVKSLVRQGHQVVLALKDAFYFHSPVLWDLGTDPVLAKATDGIFVLDDDAVSKNQLLQYLREYRLVIISDGTAEQMNLYRVSVTFARAWKECDVVIAKGRRNAGIFLGTSHEFTRDVLCFWRANEGVFKMQCKPKSERIRKFTESDLIHMADGIIEQMREARENGKSVMFYSAIIGSIPGQTRTAIKVVTVFVKYLRNKLDNTFIINPAEHFENGLDGDDLMFMWERVQRSGYLDVWRFQTVDDIEVSFDLLGKKVPSAWMGKDSTFSTGCTKEMIIAMDVQSKHPEMQIIGPSAEKFFRRREYGVGKYFDARIKQ
ncbi:MAG: ARMT1-like domain-containing protein [Deltaproteobacteria bacterium]|nr:ARMT1-like domain-containing protein [Deltaproteobacteria bacterium]